MKKTIIFIISIFLIIQMVHPGKKDKKPPVLAMDIINDVELQKVIDIEGMSKSDIYNKLLEYIEKNYVNDESEILEKSEDIISGIGNMTLRIKHLDRIKPGTIVYKRVQRRDPEGTHTFDIFFNYTFDIKDNKIRFILTDIYDYEYDYESGNKMKDYFNHDYVRGVSITMEKKKILKKMVDFIKGTEEKEDW